MPRPFNWTIELIERVRHLYWGERKRPSEIITILGLPLTHQAITGMFHRKSIPVRDLHQSLCLRPKRVVSNETKKKLSLALKGKPLTRKNWHPTEEHKARLRLYRPTEEAREKISQKSRAMWANPSHKENHSKYMRQMWQDPIRREEASQRVKAMWQDPVHKEKHLRASRQALGQRPTMPEGKVLKAITSYKLPYIYNGAACNLIISGRCPDFVNTNGKKAVIEVFGDYWHCHTKDYGQTEQGRKEIFEPLGFKLLILWGSHIKEASLETLAKEIQAFTSRC